MVVPVIDLLTGEAKSTVTSFALEVVDRARKKMRNLFRSTRPGCRWFGWISQGLEDVLGGGHGNHAIRIGLNQCNIGCHRWSSPPFTPRILCRELAGARDLTVQLPHHGASQPLTIRGSSIRWRGQVETGFW